MNFLSSFNRTSLLQKLSSEQFDLLIIGGGITGAGIALDAASRGIKTALVEKGDFAAGTSSRSTKLIHGGLRYLKQGELALVKEVARERAIVYRNAPHLVIPEKMLLPLIINGTGKFTVNLGLWIYELLAGVVKEDRKKMLSKKQTSEAEPLLRTDIITGGCIYTEYRTDDARLTIEIIKTAVKYNACCINYSKAENFIYDNNKICGAVCKDLISDKTFTVFAKQIVNATGPWVDKVRKKDGSLSEKRLHLTKGVHLVIKKDRLPVRQSIYFNSPDNRNVFAIPRGNTTYIGTTDTDYSGKLKDPPVTKYDADYLIKAVNYMFPDAKLSLSDIVSSWAGIRPLIHQEGKLPSEISRKDEIFISRSGLISIAGGKLTGYRKMAQKVVDLVNKNLHKYHVFHELKCKTENITINGGDIENLDGYIKQVSEKLKDCGFDKSVPDYLVRTYGKQTDIILDKFYEFFNNQSSIINNQSIALARAELWFTVNNESVFHLEDFFTRRTGKLYFDIQSVGKLLSPVLQDMKNYFDWTEERCEAEKDGLERAMMTAKNFL